MSKIKKSKKYYLFGDVGYRATILVWGFYCGSWSPTSTKKTKWFATEEEAKSFLKTEKPKPADIFPHPH